MARDNVVTATVTVSVEKFISNNSPQHAALEFLNYLEQEYGARATVKNLKVTYTDDRNRKCEALQNTDGKWYVIVDGKVHNTETLECPVCHAQVDWDLPNCPDCGANLRKES